MFIKKENTGKRYVISDIHGCLKTFRELVQKINLTHEDQLFLLGDYIDRGPDSSGVLEFIFELKNQKFNIFPLCGNHENTVLEMISNYDEMQFRNFVKLINKSGDLLDENGHLKQKYLDFFQTLPFYYELDNFIIVHAGINFKIENAFQDIISLLEIRWFESNVPKDFEKTIIHGHNPTYLFEIESAVKNKRKVIPLDNGCVYNKPHKMYDYTQLGKLCCLEIDNLQLIFQDNID